MTLQQLRYFLAAAERGSFSAAAEELLMAQPSLSDQIRRLEAELGVALFARAGRRLELTEAGRMLRPHAERTLAAAEDALESVKAVRTLTGGTASFGTFGSAHHYLLGGLVQDFRRRYPDVRVRVIGQNSVEVADAVREGRLEAGLVALPVDDRGLEVRPSISEEIHYVSASPQRLAQPMTIAAIAAATLILYDVRWGAVVRIEPEIEVEYMTAALDLAARRLGDTIASPSVLVTRGFSRRLSSVSLDPPLYDTYAFVTRRNAQLSPATRALLELAERRVMAMGSGD